jgi:hypothetical protein
LLDFDVRDRSAADEVVFAGPSGESAVELGWEARGATGGGESRCPFANALESVGDRSTRGGEPVAAVMLCRGGDALSIGWRYIAYRRRRPADKQTRPPRPVDVQRGNPHILLAHRPWPLAVQRGNPHTLLAHRPWPLTVHSAGTNTPSLARRRPAGDETHPPWPVDVQQGPTSSLAQPPRPIHVQQRTRHILHGPSTSSRGPRDTPSIRRPAGDETHPPWPVDVQRGRAGWWGGHAGVSLAAGGVRAAVAALARVGRLRPT